MYRGSPFRSTWTWVTLGLGMCKVCTEAVHCVALWTRVTLGLGMCKVCTEAVHCVSSPLPALSKWSPLQAPFKPPWSPPSALGLEAPFLKPPSLEAPFKPPSRLPKVKPPWSLPKVKPPSSLREGYLQRVLRWRWSPSSLKGALPEGPRNLPVKIGQNLWALLVCLLGLLGLCFLFAFSYCWPIFAWSKKTIQWISRLGMPE